MCQKSIFMLGMIAGVAVGSAICMTVNPIDEKRIRCIRRSICRTGRDIGCMVDNLTGK